MRFLPEGLELGQFKIKHCLGAGGFGITYCAVDRKTGEELVIKENFPNAHVFRSPETLEVMISGDEESAEQFRWSRESFMREARVLSTLDHPGIVHVGVMFEALNTVYYTMNLINGTSLEDITEELSAKNERVSPGLVIDVLNQGLDILEYMHNRYVYHRDIKPANIMVDQAGKVILIDFGAARNFVADFSHTLMGTQCFYPPEQMDAMAKHGPWTDIYSFGATLYYMMTGDAPAMSTLRRYHDPNPKLNERESLRGLYPSKILMSIDKALEPEAASRFSSAAEWKSFIRKIPS